MESSQEANAQALQELSAKLQREYEEKLQEEQRKHREEIENLQVCILYCLCIYSQNSTSHSFSASTVETTTCWMWYKSKTDWLLNSSDAFGLFYKDSIQVTKN